MIVLLVVPWSDIVRVPSTSSSDIKRLIKQATANPRKDQPTDCSPLPMASMHRMAVRVSAIVTPRIFTTPAHHSRGDQLDLTQVSAVIQWQVFHLPRIARNIVEVEGLGA